MEDVGRVRALVEGAPEAMKKRLVGKPNPLRWTRGTVAAVEGARYRVDDYQGGVTSSLWRDYRALRPKERLILWRAGGAAPETDTGRAAAGLFLAANGEPDAAAEEFGKIANPALKKRLADGLPAAVVYAGFLEAQERAQKGKWEEAKESLARIQPHAARPEAKFLAPRIAALKIPEAGVPKTPTDKRPAETMAWAKPPDGAKPPETPPIGPVVPPDGGKAPRPPSPLSIADLWVATGGKAEVAALGPGVPYNTTNDIYVIRSMPAGYEDATWIRTPAGTENRESAAAEWLKFRVDRPVWVLVAYDERAKAIPQWLRLFERTPDAFVGTTLFAGSRPGETAFRIYRKRFEQGTVVLGANRAAGWEGHFTTQYFAGVRPVDASAPGIAKTPSTPVGPAGALEVKGLRATSGSTCAQAVAKPGTQVYTNGRDTRLGKLPASLTGAVLIQTNINDGKISNRGVEFEVSRKVRVWVAYDTHVPGVPSWLKSFEPSPEAASFVLKGVVEVPMTLYRKEFGPGKVVLGPNDENGVPAEQHPRAPPSHGSPQYHVMYFVIVEAIDEGEG